MSNPQTQQIAKGDKETRLALRDNIEQFQVELQNLAGSEHGDRDSINENGLTEFITGGAYTRVLRVAKDTAMVSELWNKERLWILMEGCVTVTTEEGVIELSAPYIGVAPFATKAAIYVTEDALWLAVTGVDTDNIDNVKEEVIASDYSELSYEWELLEGDEK